MFFQIKQYDHFVSHPLALESFYRLQIYKNIQIIIFERLFFKDFKIWISFLTNDKLILSRSIPGSDPLTALFITVDYISQLKRNSFFKF